MPVSIHVSCAVRIEKTPAKPIVTGEDIAEQIVWVASRPDHVQVAELREYHFHALSGAVLIASRLSHCSSISNHQPQEVLIIALTVQVDKERRKHAYRCLLCNDTNPVVVQPSQ
jgi:hypothetical protein